MDKEIGFHIRLLKLRIERLKEDIEIAIGEEDPGVIKIFDKQIKKDVHMVKVQLPRVQRYI